MNGYGFLNKRITTIGFVLVVLLSMGGRAVAEPLDTVVAPKRSFFQNLAHFFTAESAENVKDTNSNSNKFSVIGAPYLESVSGLGVSAVITGLFRLPGCDSTLQASTVLLSGSYTTKGFWDIVLKGTLNFPNHDFRINFLADFEYVPSYFWGMGYHNGNNPENKTMQHKHDAVVHADALFSVVGGWRIGPAIQWNLMRSDEIARPELLEGQDRILHHYGVGATLEYDTRDVITDAKSGVYFFANQLFFPKGLSNKYAYSKTSFRVNYYCGLWHNASLASELCSEWNYGTVSWDAMAQVGDRYRMRGYYTGRYRDNNMWTCQLELRQRIWHRHGMVAWLGGGNVFQGGHAFSHFLPNCGLGYRFELNKRTNIRFDFGFAKSGQTGFMFNINEAF